MYSLIASLTSRLRVLRLSDLLRVHVYGHGPYLCVPLDTCTDLRGVPGVHAPRRAPHHPRPIRGEPGRVIGQPAVYRGHRPPAIRRAGMEHEASGRRRIQPTDCPTARQSVGATFNRLTTHQHGGFLAPGLAWAMMKLPNDFIKGCTWRSAQKDQPAVATAKPVNVSKDQSVGGYRSQTSGGG